jgi:hypothetical protein
MALYSAFQFVVSKEAHQECRRQQYYCETCFVKRIVAIWFSKETCFLQHKDSGQLSEFFDGQLDDILKKAMA